jgi:NAD-dependent DNA ligase
MKQSEVKTHIEKLRREIEEHNHRYYVLNQPLISDFEYDILLNELDTLEKKFPEFAHLPGGSAATLLKSSNSLSTAIRCFH